MLCQDGSSAAQASGYGNPDGSSKMAALCASGCFGEMSDCESELIAQGMPADQLAEIQMMTTVCDPNNADCVTGMDTLTARMDAACVDQPCWESLMDGCTPTSCSHQCAVVAGPFLKKCGSIMSAMLEAKLGDSNAPAKIATFSGLCSASMGH